MIDRYFRRGSESRSELSTQLRSQGSCGASVFVKLNNGIVYEQCCVVPANHHNNCIHWNGLPVSSLMWNSHHIYVAGVVQPIYEESDLQEVADVVE